jgi:hypothetical protein
VDFVDIWQHYNAIEIAFKDDAFVVSKDLINIWNKVLPLIWM